MATGRISTYPDGGIAYEAAWNFGPLQTFPPPLWTDISSRVLGPWDTSHGRNAELDRNEASEWRPALDNRDGGLDPGNPSGPYYPQIAPYKAVRLRLPFGPNLLTADQASAGEASAVTGGVPAQWDVLNDAGYPLSIVASATAFQGTQVYQAVLPTGASAGASILTVQAAQVIPGQPYTFQAQARITAGNSAYTSVEIAWYDNLGNSLGSTAGTAVAINSGSATWIQLTASTTAAPAGAFSAHLRVQLYSGTLTASTTWQVDGLQWEESATATAWQMPGVPGANLLPRAIATGTASIDPVTDKAANWFTDTSGFINTIAQATNLTPAPTGATTAVAWTSPLGTTSSTRLYCGVVATGAPSTSGPVADCVQVTAAQQYTASTYLMRVTSADGTIQTECLVTWFDDTGTALSTSTGTAVTVAVGSWVRATVTATAPAGAVWGRPGILISTPASTAGQNTIYSTSWQMEQAGAASTWVDPGPTYFAFTGAFEQFPQKWRLSGTWGESDAIGVDSLAGLAQRTLRDPFLEEVLAAGPNFFFTLDDPAGSSSVADATGQRIAAPIESCPTQAGSLTLGNAVTSSGVGFIGAPGPVATLANNPGNAGGAVQDAETFVSLHKTTVTPGPPPDAAWTRIIHFRASSAPASGAAYTLWEAQPSTAHLNGNATYVGMAVATGGYAQLTVSGQTGTAVGYVGTTDLCDGDWHELAIAVYAPSGNVLLFVDGAQVTPNQHGGNTVITLPLAEIDSDVLGASVQLGAGYYRAGHVGDLALALELPFGATAAQITNLYNSWRNASSGESTGARLTRLLTWVGYTGPTLIDSGSTQSMGPATDLTGQSALDGAFSIATTENGNVFTTVGGVLRFMARSALYNSLPVFVFGEQEQWGEWPYEDADLPTDPILTYNIIPVQQYSTGQVATAQDEASQKANYERTLPQRTLNVTSFAEVQSAATYLLGRYSVNRQRCSLLKLHASAIQGLARVCARLEIGTRIRVMKRPPYRATGSPIQFDGFVQKADWSLDANRDLWLTIQASPADLDDYWTLAALHTTLSTQATLGTNTATIDALPDAAYNQLAQSLPQGQQFTFEPGTPRQETMTVAPGGIPATVLGYTSATLTFTTNFTYTHSAGTVVCEPLPTGYTDPTTWDANSVLGVAYTTVTGGGASGSNTVTVGPLPDAATNPLGANWNAGDQITLSPGTVNAETVTILSVAATVPGYTGCQITLTANLAHPHAIGDYVCDPLPAGVTSPTAVHATTRLSY